MIDETERRRLERLAVEMRWNIVQMMGPGKAHHFGGSLSAADIMTALYFYKMRFDPQNPRWPERDRFLMSKGHSVPAQYAALAMLGVLDMAELPTLKKMGSRLQGHPAMHETPGIEGCTGALGEGLSYANGMALAGRIQGGLSGLLLDGRRRITGRPGLGSCHDRVEALPGRSHRDPGSESPQGHG